MKKNVLIVTPTNSGKSIIGFARVALALVMGKIGVFLVPTKELLKAKIIEIKDFFGDLVVVMKISGEHRPSIDEIKKAEGRLIFVATYEAFRSFLFSVQKKTYFNQKKIFGGIVIDEIHNIGIKDRGQKLESLIYKLRDEHNSQFCFLSATITRKSAKFWADRFDSKLIFKPLRRKFEFGDTEIKDSLSNNLKAHYVIIHCTSMINELTRVGAIKDPNEIPDQHVIIFCYSRNSSRLISEQINFDLGHMVEFLKSNWSCSYIHAGLDEYTKNKVINEFRQPKGIRIICCSPVLEVGIDIRTVNSIVITDVEKYTGIQLNQMIGRIRTIFGKVTHLVFENYQDKFEKMLKVDQEDDSYFYGYEMEEVKSRIGPLFAKRLILERLFYSMIGITTLKKYLKNVLMPNTYKIIEERLPKYLNALKTSNLIRENKGKYGLTFIGDACVESQLDMKYAIRLNNLFEQKEDVPTSKECQEKIATFTSEIHVKGDSALYTYGDTKRYKNWNKDRKEQVRKFIGEYSKNIDINAEIMKKSEIDPGDAETYRKTALWLSICNVHIYRGRLMHENSKFRQNYYLNESKLKEVIDDKDDIIQRMSGLIEKFQKNEDEERIRRPKNRMHHIRNKKAKYIKIILLLLKKAGNLGLTVKEIVKIIKRAYKFFYFIHYFFRLKSYKKLPRQKPVKAVTIRRTLNKTLKGEVEFVKEYGTGGAPAKRYFLKGMKPKIYSKYQCKECKFFKFDPTLRRTELETVHICKKTDEPAYEKQFACGSFKPKMRNFKIIYEFKVYEEKILCPGCGKPNTIKIPSPNEIIVCKDCNILIKRIKGGKYIIKWGINIPENRIKSNAEGISYIPIYSDPRVIFLNTYSKFKIKKNKKHNIPLIYVNKRCFFLDEVKLIILAGGTIENGNRKFLEEKKIGIIEYPEEKIEKLEKKEKKAAKLRNLIRKKKQRGELIDIGRKMVLAKIFSNISLTSKLGEFVLDSEQTQKYISIQYDLIALSHVFENPDIIPFIILRFILGFYSSSESYFKFPKAISHLRSMEGLAENEAWKAQKKGVYPRFKVIGRQKSRYVRSDLFYWARAYDRYNAALNYLYYLLQLEVSTALGAAGFSKYWPGPGIIHSREKFWSKKKKQGKLFPVEGKKNRELIYDFMDAYRPVFRHELGVIIRKFELSKADFLSDYHDKTSCVHYNCIFPIT